MDALGNIDHRPSIALGIFAASWFSPAMRTLSPCIETLKLSTVYSKVVITNAPVAKVAAFSRLPSIIFGIRTSLLHQYNF